MTQQPTDERYALIEQLGRGGMGTVWRALDTVLEREVAVKDIALAGPAEQGDASTVQARALREARAAAQLAHQSVAKVFDVESGPDRVRIVMELVEGETLVDLVDRSGGLAPGEAAALGVAVLGGLTAAHDKRVIHRDVKPANVMLDAEGHPKLTDFGVASLRDDPRLTATGHVMGSPSYMAPEQARGATATPACDLWGLGATLYFAVEGRPPFDRGEPFATLTAVLEEEPRSPQRAGALEPALWALLTKDPTARPDAETTRSLLEQAMEAERGTAAEAVAPSPRRPRRPRRAVLAAAVVAVLGFGGAALASLATSPDDDADEQVEDTRPAEEPREPPAEQDERKQAETEGTGADNEPDAGAEDPDNVDSAPQGWTAYTDDALGYSLQVPGDWRVVPVGGHITDFRDPRSASYLRVDYTSNPPASAVGAWEEMSASFAAGKANYEEIRIEPVTYQGYDGAMWEYRYTEGGVTLHAANLGFGTDEFGQALNFVTAEEDWAGSQDLFDAFRDSFEPAGPPPS